MKINFVKDLPNKTKEGEIVVSISSKEKDEVVVENGLKTLYLGLGKKEEITKRKLLLVFRRIISCSKKSGAKKVYVNFSDLSFKHLNISDADLAEKMATNFLMANYKFVSYKEKPKEGWDFVDEVCVVGVSDANLKKHFERGLILGEMVNFSRDLSNTPGADMTPKILAGKAKEIARGTNVKVSVLGEKEMQKLKMGAILAVGQGSKEESQFIVMEYWGGPKNEKATVLIGKGVTFDTGGLNIKPGDYMLGMNMDMSGGSAVISTIVSASKLGIKKNIIALIPSVENSPSGESYRPGDLVKSMSGKVIEVMNTDAEGRVILADAITYAKKYNPKEVIDVATLTGAALVALGERASAIFSRDEQMIEKMREGGEKSGDFVWPLPLWEEYEEEVKGKFGDVTNTHNKGGRYGGTINGAVFLLQFAKDLKCSWMHIDMAPRMEAVHDEFLEEGSAGSPVRLLVEYLQ